MFDRILEILSSLGLPGLFGGVFLEALGLPFPGSVLVALAGFLSRQGDFPILLAWVVALVAYLLGSLSAFLIGRHIGEPFIERYGRYFHLTPERFERAQQLLIKSAPGYIIGGRFLPTVGNITPYVAGVSGISWIKFILLDLIHAVLWLTTFLGVGAIFGRNWQKILEGQWANWLILFGGALLLFYLVRHFVHLYPKNKI